MPRHPSFARAVFGALLVAALGSGAQGQAEGKAAPAIEPGVFEALDKMGAYLRTLVNFEIRAQSTIDEVLLSGQKLQFGSTVQIRAKRPDHLWMEVSSDRKQRQFFFDGKTFTIWGPRTGYYASSDFIGTLSELGDRVEEKYGLTLPLADLFRWGTTTGHPNIKEAIYVGPDHVGEIPCNHYAARQDGLDWQLWIQKGDAPLPVKLVITTTDDDAQPQYVSVLNWNLAPAFTDSMFTFEPPKDAYRIAIREIPEDTSR